MHVDSSIETSIASSVRWFVTERLVSIILAEAPNTKASSLLSPPPLWLNFAGTDLLFPRHDGDMVGEEMRMGIMLQKPLLASSAPKQ